MPAPTRLLNRADAVVVLGRSDLSDAVHADRARPESRLPGAAVETLERRLEFFSSVTMPATDGLPELLVYLRQARLEQESRKVKVRDTEAPITTGSCSGPDSGGIGSSPGAGHVRFLPGPD